MAHSITTEVKCRVDGVEIGGEFTTIAGSRRSISEDVPAETSGLSVACPIDVSALKLLFIITDVDMTLTFEGPDTEMQVDAGMPIFWHYLSQVENPFGTVDVTSITVDNATSSEGTLRIEILTDPTP